MRACVAIMAIGAFASACTRHGSPERGATLRDSSTPSFVVDAGNEAHGAAAGNSENRDDADAEMRAPLGGFPQQFELLDGKEELGFVAVPLGAREPRPLMIAIDGGSERPARACAAWRKITEAYPFVVCPRGWGGVESSLGWQSPADTRQRIARAVTAAKASFGPWIEETSSVVLAGFSMGGSQVALVARGDPRTYRRVAVGDSAHDPQPALTFSRAWVKGGGERALFLCTTSGCEDAFRRAAKNVATQKAPARLNIAPTQVHGLSEAAMQSMRRDWPWLVEGAEGWERYVPPSDPSLPGKSEGFEPSAD